MWLCSHDTAELPREGEYPLELWADPFSELFGSDPIHSADQKDGLFGISSLRDTFEDNWFFDSFGAFDSPWSTPTQAPFSEPESLLPLLVETTCSTRSNDISEFETAPMVHSASNPHHRTLMPTAALGSLPLAQKKGPKPVAAHDSSRTRKRRTITHNLRPSVFLETEKKKSKKKRRVYRLTQPRIRWTPSEHARFLQGIRWYDWFVVRCCSNQIASDHYLLGTNAIGYKSRFMYERKPWFRFVRSVRHRWAQLGAHPCSEIFRKPQKTESCSRNPTVATSGEFCVEILHCSFIRSEVESKFQKKRNYSRLIMGLSNSVVLLVVQPKQSRSTKPNRRFLSIHT